jgi:hypothetical protein
MAKITRKFQRVFCGDVPANNVVAQFGSLKASLPQYSSDPDVIQQLAAWGAGWTGATVANSAPPLQDMNALFYVLSRQMGYLMQTGIAEYNSSTIYYIGSLAYDGVNNIYKCLDDDVTNIPFSDTTKWVLFHSDKRTEISANYVVLFGDKDIVATAAIDLTVTLPQALTENKGRIINIKSKLTGGKLITISASGGSLIDGNASVAISNGSNISLRSSGGDYEIV